MTRNLTRSLTHIFRTLLLLAFVAPLTACGITGNLKTPPPVWGEKTDADMPDETTSADSLDTDDEEDDDPFDIYEDDPIYDIEPDE
jgi:predicted small lipoprotein YifL